MRATSIMMLAVAMFIIHRWALDEPAVNTQIAVSGLFAILVIAFLDQGVTEPVAKGFAYLFLFAAAYNAVPDLAKAAQAGAKTSGS
jgi:hypothetical protein